MLKRILFWIGVMLIIGSYLWSLSGTLQHNPNSSFPVAGFIKAITPLTLLLWAIGAGMICVGARKSQAAKRRRFPIVSVIFAVLFAVPALQPLIWMDKAKSPFGAFSEPVFFVAIAIELLCCIGIMMARPRKVRELQ